MKFKWSGGKESGGKKHPFNMNENLMGPLNDSKLLKSTLNNNNNFELDSNATSSTMVPAISTLIKNDSLLKNGTWAYLDSGKNKNRRYLFWTSVNVSNFPTGTKIPVIICRADNEYYVSESTTAERTGDKITTLYKVIADHQYNAESYQKIADKGTKYDSLQAAYDAYVEKITEDSNYSQFKDTLSKKLNPIRQIHQFMRKKSLVDWCIFAFNRIILFNLNNKSMQSRSPAHPYQAYTLNCK